MGQDNSFLLFIGAIFLCLFALFSPFFIIGALIAGYKGIKIMLHNRQIDIKSQQFVLVYYRLKDVDYSEKRYCRIYNLPEFERLDIEGNSKIDILVRYQATEDQCKQYAQLNNLKIN
jgi:hypothetical protein